MNSRKNKTKTQWILVGVFKDYPTLNFTSMCFAFMSYCKWSAGQSHPSLHVDLGYALSCSQVVCGSISNLDRISQGDDAVHTGRIKSKVFSLSFFCWSFHTFDFCPEIWFEEMMDKIGSIRQEVLYVGGPLSKPLFRRWAIGIIPYSSSHLTVNGVIGASKKN